MQQENPAPYADSSAPAVRAYLETLSQECDRRIAILEKRRKDLREGGAPDMTEYAEVITEIASERRSRETRILEALFADTHANIDIAFPPNMDAEFKKRVEVEVEAFGRLLGEGSLSGSKISLHTEHEEKAQFYRGNINVPITFTRGTVAHELGHWLEQNDAAILREALGFLERRKGERPLVALRDETGDLRYGAEDQGYLCFPEPYQYAGKVYADGAGTEIVSVGLQHLYNDPLKFARDDPQFFDFIWTLLQNYRTARLQ